MAPSDIELQQAAWDKARGLNPGDYDKLSPGDQAAVAAKTPKWRRPQGVTAAPAGPTSAAVVAMGMNDYTAPEAAVLTEPTRFAFEKSNTRNATLTVGKRKKPIQEEVRGHLGELAPGTISPHNIYELTETDDVFVLDSDFEIVPQEEPVKFQVKYVDGGGEQIVGASVDAVRAARLEFWGDREIVSVEEIKP
jgi:hypothetical protein